MATLNIHGITQLNEEYTTAIPDVDLDDSLWLLIERVDLGDIIINAFVEEYDDLDPIHFNIKLLKGGHEIPEVDIIGNQIYVKYTRQEYPSGEITGPCICGSWPGGVCLKCPKLT